MSLLNEYGERIWQIQLPLFLFVVNSFLNLLLTPFGMTVIFHLA